MDPFAGRLRRRCSSTPRAGRLAAARDRARGRDRQRRDRGAAARARGGGAEGRGRCARSPASTSRRSSATSPALRAAWPRARALCAVVKADGYGHGAVPSARAALAGGRHRGWRWRPPTRRRSCGPAGSTAPILVMGAISAEELPIALGRRRRAGRLERAVRRRDVALGRDARRCAIHVKLDTRHGPARDPRRRPRRWRVAERVLARRPALELAGAMTHFATADERPGVRRRAARARSRRSSASCVARAPGTRRPRRQQRRDAARRRRATSTWSAAGSRSTAATR